MNFGSGFSRIMNCRHPLAVLLFLAMAVRLVLMPFFTFNIDMAYWLKAVDLIDSGQNLYGIDGYYYTPVWGYVIGLVDVIMHAVGITDLGTVSEAMTPFVGADYVITPMIPSVWFSVMIKIPLILTDIAVGYLIYAFIVRLTGDRTKALIGCALWLFCPLTIVESSMHGMFDNLSALFLLIAFIGAADRKYVFAGAAYSIAILTKFFPVFFIFLFLAVVLKNEGISAKGLLRFGTAFVSAVATMFIIEIPELIKGQFWDSMSFLLVRISLSSEFMYDISGIAFYACIAVAAAAVIAAAYYFSKVRPDIIRSRFIDISDGEREHRVRRTLMISAAVLTVLIIAYSVFATIRSGTGTFADVFSDIGMKFVLLLSVYTLLLEAYIAYRFLFGPKDDSSMLKAFMLSSAIVFLWPPAPQYVVVILPAIAIYAAVCDRRYVVPFLLFGTLMALYDLILAGPSVLFSFAEYTGIIPMSALIPSVEFITSYVGPIPTVGFFMAVFGVAAYVSMLNILYVWYRSNKEASA